MNTLHDHVYGLSQADMSFADEDFYTLSDEELLSETVRELVSDQFLRRAGASHDGLLRLLGFLLVFRGKCPIILTGY